MIISLKTLLVITYVRDTTYYYIQILFVLIFNSFTLYVNTYNILHTVCKTLYCYINEFHKVKQTFVNDHKYIVRL